MKTARTAAKDEVRVVRVGGRHDLTAAPMFLAALAYPESWEKRDEAVLALRAVGFRAALRLGHAVPACARDELRALPVQQMNGRLSRLAARIDWRLEAAEVYAMLMMEVRHEGPHHAIAPDAAQRTRMFLRKAGHDPKSVARHAATTYEVQPGRPYSLNDLARLRAGGSRHESLRFSLVASGPRVGLSHLICAPADSAACGSLARWKATRWRPEVAHLAIALHQVRLGWHKHELPFSVPALYFNPELWIGPALAAAERHVAIWQRVPLPRALRSLRTCRRVRLVPRLEKAEPVIR